MAARDLGVASTISHSAARPSVMPLELPLDHALEPAVALHDDRRRGARCALGLAAAGAALDRLERAGRSSTSARPRTCVESLSSGRSAVGASAPGASAVVGGAPARAARPRRDPGGRSLTSNSARSCGLASAPAVPASPKSSPPRPGPGAPRSPRRARRARRLRRAARSRERRRGRGWPRIFGPRVERIEVSVGRVSGVAPTARARRLAAAAPSARQRARDRACRSGCGRRDRRAHSFTRRPFTQLPFSLPRSASTKPPPCSVERRVEAARREVVDDDFVAPSCGRSGSGRRGTAPPSTSLPSKSNRTLRSGHLERSPPSAQRRAATGLFAPSAGELEPVGHPGGARAP